MLKIERIYNKPFDLDGYRILVDRMWARGISKSDAKLDQWAKDITPSPDLRKWFNHDDDKFKEFSQNYMQELEQNQDAPKFANLVQDKLKDENVILLYGAKNTKCSHAIVLRHYLNQKLNLKAQPDDFKSLLYNDGEGNRAKNLEGPYQWLKQHPEMIKKLNLNLGKPGKIYIGNSNKSLDHQSLTKLVLNRG
ncbi:hypothetical protein WR164_14130 [Philodulcilactobacillus myokoensis]|uniref:DUF488 family protein n=1 Tax=Philodulcilactobacillus myokoensis TaxID=2929573 RepID=A0A9W6B1X3_9LACO|nr:DUF488 family protein [Philodulcilactobacillus myokoensis]GLB47434.1 hypothetical protein WR164_14130 [Philodulcilactobacillus myokoensis]